MPNTHKREEICKRLALDLTFYMEEKKVEPENIFPVFPASFCSKVYYLPVFPEKFLKTGIFSSFSSKSGHPDILLKAIKIEGIF